MRVLLEKHLRRRFCIWRLNWRRIHRTCIRIRHCVWRVHVGKILKGGQSGCWRQVKLSIHTLHVRVLHQVLHVMLLLPNRRQLLLRLHYLRYLFDSRYIHYWFIFGWNWRSAFHTFNLKYGLRFLLITYFDHLKRILDFLRRRITRRHYDWVSGLVGRINDLNVLLVVFHLVNLRSLLHLQCI